MVGKKVVYYGPGDVRVEMMDAIPVPHEGELLVRVDAAAVCGSDIKAFRVGNPKMHPPMTMGHEFSGTVIEPLAALGYASGDRVTMATTVGCGECYYCCQGKPNLCSDAKPMGFFYDGAMASYMIIPAQSVAHGNVVKIQDDTPPEIAALAEPMSCVLNGLSRIPQYAPPVRNALVIGFGAMGILHALALKELGIPRIVCAGNPGMKKDMAETLGFRTITLESLEEDFKNYSDGLGFELVVTTVPDGKIQSMAPRYARKGGFVSFFAGLPVDSELITISSRTLHYNELVYFGTSDSTASHVRGALEILNRQKALVSKIITVVPIDEAVVGMHRIMDKTAAKIVIAPTC
jgi:L-iditol 2-dehydrogenase